MQMLHVEIKVVLWKSSKHLGRILRNFIVTLRMSSLCLCKQICALILRTKWNCPTVKGNVCHTAG